MTTLTTIETPERVAFTYDVAGLGTRVLAYLFDLAIRAAVVLLIPTTVLALRGSTPTALPSWGWVAALLGLFVLQWGYLTLFEAFWHGQTPGKRVMNIRVIKEGGYPISLLDAAVRNIVRVIDFLPVGYGVGVLVVFFSRRHQRLGDIVAGTLVVRQSRQRPPALDEIVTAHSRADERPPGGPVRIGLAVPEFEAIVEFLDRAETLDAESRERIAGKFAAPVRRRIAASPGLREHYPLEEIGNEDLLRAAVRDTRRERTDGEPVPGDTKEAGE